MIGAGRTTTPLSLSQRPRTQASGQDVLAADSEEDEDSSEWFDPEEIRQAEEFLESLGGSPSSGERHGSESPQTIERLGGLMTLLGPRYRTLSRNQLYQRATVGELNRFKRTEMKLRSYGADPEAAHLFSGLKGSNSRRQELPQLISDSDGNARKGYLAAEERRRTSGPGKL
jgi:hypothetical protein